MASYTMSFSRYQVDDDQYYDKYNQDVNQESDKKIDYEQYNGQQKDQLDYYDYYDESDDHKQDTLEIELDESTESDDLFDYEYIHDCVEKIKRYNELTKDEKDELVKIMEKMKDNKYNGEYFHNGVKKNFWNEIELTIRLLSRLRLVWNFNSPDLVDKIYVKMNEAYDNYFSSSKIKRSQYKVYFDKIFNFLCKNSKIIHDYHTLFKMNEEIEDEESF